MGKSCGKRAVLALMVVAMLVQGPASVTAEIDNVAFQWTDLLNTLMCNEFALALTAGIQQQLHLAQWHSLLALRKTGGCTTEEAVVAYASFKIVGHYFPWHQVLDVYGINLLLDEQLRAMNITPTQQHLAQRLGEAVAVSTIQKRDPSGEFTLGAVKKALDRAHRPPPPGVFRYYNDTPAGRASADFYFHVLALYKPFVMPNPTTFLKQFFPEISPPKIPSEEWDANWEGLKDIGRIDWPGRTPEMNLISNLVACPRVNNNKCMFEMRATAAAKSALPNTTSLYDSVQLLAKISVSMYDAGIAQVTLKYAFWFWRPTQAYRAGDSHHAPIPDWTPYAPTALEPEYPSGTVTLVSAGAHPLQSFFGSGVKVPFSIPGGGTFNCPGFVGDPVPTRNYSSLQAFIHESQLSRMYAGAHFQKSVDDAEVLGTKVAEYVEKHWAQTTPSGVLPDLTFLDYTFTVPDESGDYTPYKFDIPK